MFPRQQVTQTLPKTPIPFPVKTLNRLQPQTPCPETHILTLPVDQISPIIKLVGDQPSVKSAVFVVKEQHPETVVYEVFEWGEV
jgi:hypothetical protein